MNLTREQVRDLVKVEQMMDNGELDFVMFSGQRMAVTSDIMGELGLKTAQSISWEIFGTIQEENIKRCQLEMKMKQLKKEADNLDNHL